MRAIAERINEMAGPENTAGSARYALVVAGRVENVLLADATYIATKPNAVALPDGVRVEVGWLYDGTNFTPPAVTPPLDPTEQLRLRVDDLERRVLDLETP